MGVRGDHRKFLIPEVIQTSAMDCGPAAVKALLAGYGVHVDYEALRDACQTDVDGTSIDSLEEITIALGLDAEQVMIPVDHVLLEGESNLPALAIVTLPGGHTHFVIVWRDFFGRVQVMDPASGRSWMAREELERQLYRHTMSVGAADWRDWAGTDDFTAPLRRRARALGFDEAHGDALIAWALASPEWDRLAALDAAVRFAGSLEAGAARKGAAMTTGDLQGIVDALVGRSGGAEPLSLIPAAYWSVRPDPREEGAVLMTGAVLVRVNRGPDAASVEALARADLAEPEAEGDPGVDVATLLAGERRGILHQLWEILGEGRGWSLTMALVAMPAVAIGTVAQALAFRGLFSVVERLDLVSQRITLVGVFVALLLILLGLRLGLSALWLRLGRRLEVALRRALLEKLPRLGDHYFRSRPNSDLAERAHSLHAIRSLPSTLGTFALAGLELVLTIVAISWLYPAGWLPALLAGIVAVASPLIMKPWLTERDLRRHVHEGAMSTLYLDATRGLLPIRAHGAQRNLQRRHEGLAAEWGRSVLGYFRGLTGFQMVSQSLTTALVIWLVLGAASWGYTTGGDAVELLVVTYWGLRLPQLGEQLGGIVRRYPSLRNTAARLLEPLNAPALIGPQVERVDDEAERRSSGGWRLEFDDVDVQAAGRPILTGVEATIEPGEHVAIVGPSGAGKSSFMGLLLGWYTPARGEIRVDGLATTPERIAHLRHEIAWLDPGVQIWNRSLWENITYGGNDAVAGGGPGEILRAAQLDEVVERLPDGMRTSLGEGGGMLSGGEGQRVRVARALQREAPPLVICDEAFRGLDRSTRQELLRETRRRWASSTLLFASHDIDHSLDFDRVLVFDEGCLVEDGNPEELAAREGSLFRRMLAREREVRARLEPGNEGPWRDFNLAGGAVASAEDGSTGSGGER